MVQDRGWFKIEGPEEGRHEGGIDPALLPVQQLVSTFDRGVQVHVVDAWWRQERKQGMKQYYEIIKSKYLKN